MKKYFKLIKQLIKLNFKSIKIYKHDFIIGNITFLISNVICLISTIWMFNLNKNIKGMNINMILVLQCYYQLIFSVIHIFFDNLWNIAGKEVRLGNYDDYLLKPINSQYYSSIKMIDFSNIIPFIFNIVAIIGINYYFNIDLNLILLFLSVPFTIIIIYSIEVIVTSSVFLFKKVRSVLSFFMQLSNFAKYPLSLFPVILQFVLVVIIPFASALYFPILIARNRLFLLFVLIIVSLVTLAISIIMWKKMEKKYLSSGN